jgi:hypothetical protein
LLRNARFTMRVTQIPDSEFAMVAEYRPTGNNALGGNITFHEDVSRSNAHYYVYRVVPVNRWGVEGPATELSVRVPATMPPSVPNDVRVHADHQGFIVVDVRGGNPAEDEVVKYRVMRKEIRPTIQFAATPPTIAAAPGMNQIIPPAAAASVKFGNTPLTATGPKAARLGAGGERFGIVRHSSAAVALADTLGIDRVKNLSAYRTFMQDLGTEVGVIDASHLINTLTFTDQSVSPGTDYIYRVIAVNRDGLSSDVTAPMDATPIKTKAEKPGTVNAAYDGRVVTLSWVAARRRRICREARRRRQ